MRRRRPEIVGGLTSLSTTLEQVLPLGADSIDVLSDRCGRRVSDAKRLNHIVSERAAALGSLTRDDIEELLERRGISTVIQDDKIRLTKETASDFLDLVEGRLFNDDVTGEERRADAYSPRTAP